MTLPVSAMVLGGSGSVGAALMRELLWRQAFTTVVSLGRRSQPDQLAEAKAANVELRVNLLRTMDADSVQRAATSAAMALDGAVVGFSVLGVGAGTARLTIEQHRAVDNELNGAFARELAASGRVVEKLLPVFSFITPAKFKSITAAQIATAMVAVARATPSASAVYRYPEMITRNR